MPARYLELAAKDWVRRNPYLPKANELVALAKAFVDRQHAPETRVNDIQKKLAMLPHMNATRSRHDIEWCVDAAGDFYMRDLK